MSSNPPSHKSSPPAWRSLGRWVRLSALERSLGFFIGVTTRAAGDMKIPSIFARTLQMAGLDSAAAGGKQVHGRRVRRVVRPTGFEGIPGTDGVATDRPGLPLRVYAADCAPVFLLDGRSRAWALIHAGWRGTQGGVLESALRLLRQKGVSPRDLWMAVGPCLRACCYEVGPEVARLFPGAAVPRRGAPGKFSLDLVRALSIRAARAGIRIPRFLPAPFCTGCDPRFFSFRREKTAARLAAVLRRTPPKN